MTLTLLFKVAASFLLCGMLKSSDVFTSGKPFTIVGLGDSTTAGTPGFMSPRESPPIGKGDVQSQYAYWIQKERPDWKVFNEGVRGQRTDQIKKRMESAVYSHRPDVVVVLAGINDLHQGYSEEEAQKNLEGIYNNLSDRGIPFIICTTLPYNLMTPEVETRLLKLNTWIASYAIQNKIPLCDTYKILSVQGRLINSPDDIHPDVAGYRKIGEALIPLLEKFAILSK